MPPTPLSLSSTNHLCPLSSADCTGDAAGDPASRSASNHRNCPPIKVLFVYLSLLIGRCHRHSCALRPADRVGRNNPSAAWARGRVGEFVRGDGGLPGKPSVHLHDPRNAPSCSTTFLGGRCVGGCTQRPDRVGWLFLPRAALPFGAGLGHMHRAVHHLLA